MAHKISILPLTIDWEATDTLHAFSRVQSLSEVLVRRLESLKKTINAR